MNASLNVLCRSLRPPCKIQDDSRAVQKGDVFIAVKGFRRDGHIFIPEAVKNGAQTLVVEDKENIPSDFEGSVYKVDSTKKIRSQLLNQYYNSPSEKMFCIGVTGTNGKTTTTYMIEHILSAKGWNTGVIGTINHHLNGKVWSSHLTTPNSVELYERLSDFRRLSAQAVVMEVSSIGLDQNRIDGVDFNIAVFTNFTQDHLDYHKDMASYFKAKTKFFELIKESGSNCMAVLNTDDEHIYNYSKTIPLSFVSYGKSGEHFSYEIFHEGLDGIKCNMFYNGDKIPMQLPLIGSHNASNAMAAIAVAVAAGFSFEKSIKCLESFKGVPGRLERIHPSYVFVDYAHTSHALENALQSLQKARKKDQKIIVVFGCGGGRDQGKRKDMGHVAHHYADSIVITSDNPRDENPDKIVQDILQGIPQKDSHVFVHLDRKTAIQKGLEMAQDQDIVLIAGKGHESKQIIGEKEIEFSDVQVCKSILGLS
ncbi:MAG: UDP-N-acetylmuramoyl-L-alanyl-D-glutamate--2,6-diaminopimelate ligase [Bdellovibrionales bacterium]|nr:UDP-N-acetylmuramoyl-L-alanyl-D-glutamate--2,6-diaminopimelate ligase [Bdellovibrionales bacterium]